MKSLRLRFYFPINFLKGAAYFHTVKIGRECGGFYGSKLWHSNDKYIKVIWHKFKNKKKCKTPHLTEEQIKEEFVKVFNKLISNKDEVIKDCKNTVLSLANTEYIDSKMGRQKTRFKSSQR